MPKRKKKDSLWEQVKSAAFDKGKPKGKPKDEDSVTMKAEGGGEAVASQSDNPYVGDISRGGRLALTGTKFRGVR